jgi:hypothetical protein
MSILIKGKDFGPTEQVTSTKLDELVDNASFTDDNENSVAYTGTTGTCLLGGGLEVTSLGQLQIADSGVNTNEISDGAVTNAKIADLDVSTSKITNLAVITGKIGNNAVTQAKIANDAVGADQLASSAVVTDSIVNLNVTTAKIANDAITTDKIANDAITTDKIADDVELGGNPTTTTQAATDNSTRIATTSYVTSGIANALTGSGGIFGTIDQTADSNPKIFSKNSSGEYDSVAPSGDVAMTQAGAFTIQDDAVTASKIDFIDDSLAATDGHILIADGTEFNNKAVSGDVAITNTGNTTIQANAVEGTMLNSNTADDSTIELSGDTLSVKDSGITTVKLNNSAVTTAKIADSTGASDGVTTAKIADDAVTGAKISDTAALPDGVTATTQSAGNNTTKVATTAFVETAVSSNGLAFSILTSLGGVRTDSSFYYKDMSESYDPYNLITFSSGNITFASTGTYLIELVGTFRDTDTTVGPTDKYGLSFTSSTSSTTNLMDEVTNVSFQQTNDEEWHPYSVSYIRTISDVSTDKLAIRIVPISGASSTQWQSKNVVLKISKLT